jgi:hypothetical protein
VSATGDGFLVVYQSVESPAQPPVPLPG